MLSVLEEIGEERRLLYDISWEAYEALLKTWQSSTVRLTYDRGTLEIMSPLLRHELFVRLIGRLIETFTLELQIPLQSGGSTTFKREIKKRGLEPDECYWIQNAPFMQTKKKHDLASDPPPDLAIEVEITHSPLDRMDIYSSLGIPEVWRYDGAKLLVYTLTENSSYESRSLSVALPSLLPNVIEQFIAMSNEVGETEVLTSFLEWVRSEVKSATTRPRKSSDRSRKKKRGS